LGENDRLVYDARILQSRIDSRYECFSKPEEVMVDSRSHNYEFVDLGLSVLWGSEALSSGSTGLKTIWMNDNQMKMSGFINLLENLERFNQKPDSSLYKRYDVVNKRLGGCCRAPAKKEMEELLSSCTWKPETRISKNCSDGLPKYEFGFKVTGPSGQSIHMCSSEYWSAYWTSSEADSGYAFALALGRDPNQKYALDNSIIKEEERKKKYWEELAKSKALIHEIRKRPILLPIEQYLNQSNPFGLHPLNAAWWPVIDK
jgi:hypothetical protein